MYVLNESIDAAYVKVRPYGSCGGSLPVHIPSLMPKIPVGLPKTTPVSLNKSCYCNATECKPSVATKITTQNYVTAKAPYHSFDHSLYSFGGIMKVHVETEDCLTCRIFTEDLDNSWDL